MQENIFSGLEELGFNDIQEVDLFNKRKAEEKDAVSTVNTKKMEDPRTRLYDTSVTCPVCKTEFKARTVKVSAYRRQESDSDFFVRYASINPYFYEVWLCNSCGYAAMKQYFSKVRDSQVELIHKKITSKWRGREYSEIYAVEDAIERYKLALLNCVAMEDKASIKAITCLRIAWMYRLIDDEGNEQLFLKQALEGLSHAYLNEAFPICGMDKYTVTYLIGELNRRTENIKEANLWFSKVITTPGVPQKLKDLSREQRELTKEVESKLVKAPEDIAENKTKKKGFFSIFFK
jgi:uncharacterized protein